MRLIFLYNTVKRKYYYNNKRINKNNKEMLIYSSMYQGLGKVDY